MRLKNFPKLLAGFLLLFALLPFPVAAVDKITGEPTLSPGKYLVYIGTYTGKSSKGIYAFQMDKHDGTLTPLGLVAETPSPAFLDIDPQGKTLFAINEIGRFRDKPTGSVTAFSIDPASGLLTQIDECSSIGSGPCYVSLDSADKNVLVANYTSGSVAAIPIKPDGHLGAPTAFVQHTGKSINPGRQAGPHAHCLTLDAANRFAFACDLGLDKILVYKFDSSHGTLVPGNPPFVSVKPGAGPRHIVFHPDGRQAYVVNELDSILIRFAYDADSGVLTEKQTVATVPDDFKGQNYPAEVVVHPSGKFVYASNRGHNSIAIFAVDSATGALKNIGYEPTRGKFPRSFAFTPAGDYLVAGNQNSGSVVVFRVDPASGRLKFTSQIGTPVPTCIKFFAGQ